MNDTLQFLKAIKANTKTVKNVDKLLTKLGYEDDGAKDEFLQSMRSRDFIKYEIAGQQPQIYTTNSFNERTGFKAEAKPLKFSARITEAGQAHLAEYLSKKKSDRKSTITLVISGLVGIATITSVTYNIYQSQTIKEKDAEIKILKFRTDSLLTKLSHQDSIVKELAKRPYRDTALHIPQTKTNSQPANTKNPLPNPQTKKDTLK